MKTYMMGAVQVTDFTPDPCHIRVEACHGKTLCGAMQTEHDIVPANVLNVAAAGTLFCQNCVAAWDAVARGAFTFKGKSRTKKKAAGG